MSTSKCSSSSWMPWNPWTPTTLWYVVKLGCLCCFFLLSCNPLLWPGSRAMCSSTYLLPALSEQGEAALLAELCFRLVNEKVTSLVRRRSSPWWPAWVVLLGACQVAGRGACRSWPLAEGVGIKLPCLLSSVGKGKIFYKPIFKRDSKPTVVLFINPCMGEKSVFSWYCSKTSICAEALHACSSSLKSMVTLGVRNDKQQKNFSALYWTITPRYFCFENWPREGGYMPW